jgi:hypothetical protein
MGHREYGVIDLTDLTRPHPDQLREHSTEWLCRAKEQLPARIAAFASVPSPATAESEALLARLVHARAVVEAELDERLARTLTELPNLAELRQLGYRHPGRAW